LILFDLTRIRNDIPLTIQTQDAADSDRSDHHGEDAIVLRDERSAEEGETHESGNEADCCGEGPRDPGDLRLYASEEQASQNAAFRGPRLPERIKNRGHFLGTLENRGVRAASRKMATILPAVAVSVCIR